MKPCTLPGITLTLMLSLLLSSCQRQEPPASDSRSAASAPLTTPHGAGDDAGAGTGQQAERKSTAQSAARQPAHAAKLWAAITYWLDHQAGAAEESLLDMARTAAPLSDWLLYGISEADFILLPPAELESRKAEMLATFEALRELVQQVVDRAYEHLAAQRFDEVAPILTALDRLAEANQGESVTQLAAMHGRWAEQQAQRLRDALSKARAGGS